MYCGLKVKVSGYSKMISRVQLKRGKQYQMKSVQWLQNVGCLKNRAVNWWSFTSTTLLCLSAPFLWKTGSLGGGERGEGRGEEVGDGEDSARGERDGDGETGVDMLPATDRKRLGEKTQGVEK